MTRRTFAITLAAAGKLHADGVEMQPFPVDSTQLSGGEADLSFLLDAPAGKGGFIRIQNGHLATPAGRRFRIWGTNVVAGACTPTKEGARIIAAQFARFGLNCIRFHFLDRPAPNGIIDSKRDDTRGFDPEYMDRFDFFVSELKRRGIYVNLNLNVGRTYKQGDGVRDFEYLGFAKALTYFDERLLELQREYATRLLTHYNPYTKAEYRHEPAVLLLEMVNENSIVEAWVHGRLLGTNTTRNPGTWTDITASYEQALTAKYNAWLAQKLGRDGLEQFRRLAAVGEGGQVPRLRPAELATAPAERFRTEASFYMELEDRYFQSMRDLIREELGAGMLLVGTRANTVYPLLRSTSRLDIVDGHEYWQHPHWVEDATHAGRRGFEIGNSPMVNDPLHSTPVTLSKAACAGKPYTVSEINHPFPSEYACEGIPILTAYAAFQDWDGIFWFSYGNSDPSGYQDYQSGHFLLRPDPVKMSEIAAGALTFLRGDITPARETVPRHYSAEQVIDSLRLPASERHYYTPGFPLSIPLRHATRVASLDGESMPSSAGTDGGSVLADTRELAWHAPAGRGGLVTVDTPRSQALVGFVREHAKSVTNFSANVKNTFCAIMMTSIDGKPLAESGKVLLVAGSRVANTSMKWNEKRTSLMDWGRGPAVIEPVTGTITLRGLRGAKTVKAMPLDSAGCAKAEISGRKVGAGWEIPIGIPATSWYVIMVDR